MKIRNDMKNKYLIAFGFRGTKGFNCPTILVSATDEVDAIALANHLRPNKRVTDIKKVDY